MVLTIRRAIILPLQLVDRNIAGSELCAETPGSTAPSTSMYRPCPTPQRPVELPPLLHYSAPRS